MVGYLTISVQWFPIFHIFSFCSSLHLVSQGSEATDAPDTLSVAYRYIHSAYATHLAFSHHAGILSSHGFTR